MADDKKMAEVRTRYSQDYRAIFVTNATGGANPDGYIMLDLFNDAPGYVETHEVEVVDGRAALNPEDSHPIAVRELQVRLFMTIEAARRIKNFIDSKLEEAEGK